MCPRSSRGARSSSARSEYAAAARGSPLRDAERAAQRRSSLTSGVLVAAQPIVTVWCASRCPARVIASW
jgi:hypothetical protein